LFKFELNKPYSVPHSRYTRSLLLILLTLVECSLQLSAQDPYHIHFDVNNGLPSDEVYGILFDNRKVLWGTTDRGVFRYDGYQFKHFTVTDGLNENVNLKIYYDDFNNRVYVTSLNNYICYIQGDSVYEHPFSRSVNRLGGFTSYAQQIRFHPDGTLDLCFNHSGLYRLAPGMEVDTLNSHRERYPDATVFIQYDPSGRSIWDMYPKPNPDPDAPSSVVMTDDGFYLTCGVLPMPSTNSSFRLGIKSFIYVKTKSLTKSF